MASEESAETVSSATKVDRDLAAEALNHLIQGKRHLLVQDIPSAVASLQDACKLVVECYGEMANECGEAYFYYGKALLELARDEAGVFGTVLEEGKGDEDEDAAAENDEDSQDEEEEESDETDDTSNGAKEAETEKQEGSSSEVQGAKENTDEKVDSSKDENPSLPGTEVLLSCTDVTAQPGSSAGKAESTSVKEEDEEVTNLQLAWETLELAKIIFQRQSEGDRDILLKLAEVHLHLGEVSLESENYDQAVEDMQRCLAIRQDLLNQNDRLLAETHYQLGLALCFDNFFDDAIKHFQSAVGVIKDRIISLKLKKASKNENKINQDTSSNDDESIEGIEREIEDLEEILPEIEEKVTDTEDMKKSTADKLRDAALNTGLLSKQGISPPAFAEPSHQSDSSFAGQSAEKVAKPIANINHLVKRKRKPEEDNITNQLEKKPRPDEVVDIRCVSSSSAHQLPSVHLTTISTANTIQQIHDNKSDDIISFSSTSSMLAKNDSDVSSTTLLSSEEKSETQKQCHFATENNEAMESDSPSKQSKATVCKSGAIQDLTYREALSNGDDTKKVVSSDSSQENVIESAN